MNSILKTKNLKKTKTYSLCFPSLPIHLQPIKSIFKGKELQIQRVHV